MTKNNLYHFKVKRKSEVIMGNIKSITTSFKTEDIVNKVFKIKKDHPEYIYHHLAVESFLKSRNDVNGIQKEVWIYDPKPSSQPSLHSTITEEVVHTLKYGERVKGYMKVAQNLAEQIRTKLNTNDTLEVSYDDCTYEFNYNGGCLFGNGVMDFFADANLNWDQEITFQTNESPIKLIVPKQNGFGHSEKVNHSQLDQIEDSMKQEEKSSFYTTLYELLACYPTGLTTTEIYNHFLDYQIATIYDLKNILKQNECFSYDVVEDIWIIHVNKIQRYYKDEHGNPAENQLSYGWLGFNTLQEKHENEESLDHEKCESQVKSTELQHHDEEQPSIKDQNGDTMIGIVKELEEIFVDPDKMKEEIDHLVIECFKNGKIDVLEKCNQDALNVHSYFSNVKKFLNHWKGNNE